MTTGQSTTSSGSSRDTETERRRQADSLSRRVGLIVLIVGASLAFIPSITPLPDKTPSARVERTVSTQTQTDLSSQQPKATRTETITEKTGDGPTLLEEILGTRSALILLRVVLVALVALLPAAFAHRLALARFFSEVGPVKLESVSELTGASEALDERLTEMEQFAVAITGAGDTMDERVSSLEDAMNAVVRALRAQQSRDDA